MAEQKLTAVTALGQVIAEDLLFVDSSTEGRKKATAQQVQDYIGAPELLYVREEYPNTTGGQTSSTATWNIRVLNTVEVNQITGASVATNQITLPAGTYRIWVDAYVKSVGDTKLRLRNITDSETTIVGDSGYTHVSSDDLGVRSQMMGRFTIAGEKDFEVQHWTATGSGGAFGTAASSGEVETYLDVQILREPS